MVSQTQDSTGFQRAVESLEIIFSNASGKPVVNVTKGQNHISRARGSNLRLSRRLKFGNDHRTIYGLIGLKFLLEGLGAGAACERFIELSVVLEERRQNLGIPAVARPDFDHGHLRLNSKKGERLQWMAILVASLVCCGTLGASDRRLKRGNGTGVIRGRRRPYRQECNHRERNQGQQ